MSPSESRQKRRNNEELVRYSCSELCLPLAIMQELDNTAILANSHCFLVTLVLGEERPALVEEKTRKASEKSMYQAIFLKMLNSEEFIEV